MTEVKLTVLYPYPTDIEKFNRDYQEHILLLREKMHIPADEQPYTVMRFAATEHDKPQYYQMFTMEFPSADHLQQIMNSPQMQEISLNETRISTGGQPVVMVGVEGRKANKKVTADKVLQGN